MNREDIKQVASESFYIYARPKSGGRWQALDLSTGEFVSKLFYATFLKEEEARRVLQKLTTENSAFEFEARCPRKTIRYINEKEGE